MQERFEELRATVGLNSYCYDESNFEWDEFRLAVIEELFEMGAVLADLNPPICFGFYPPAESDLLSPYTRIIARTFGEFRQVMKSPEILAMYIVARKTKTRRPPHENH